MTIKKSAINTNLQNTWSNTYMLCYIQMQNLDLSLKLHLSKM